MTPAFKANILEALLALIIMSTVIDLPTAGVTAAEPIANQQRASFAPKGERICLSLRELVRRVESACQAGSPQSTEVMTLAGMGWVEGYLVDTDSGDIILFGVRSSSWPSILLEDLLFHGRTLDGGHPYCSLDPRKENVLALDRLFKSGIDSSTEESFQKYLALVRRTCGNLSVVIGNIPSTCRLAHLLISADLEMKKGSQGLIRLATLPSCLAMRLDRAVQAVFDNQDGRMPLSSMSRFWFHVAQGDPLFVEDVGVLMIESCNMVLLTEMERTLADGTLVNAGTQDPVAAEWAHRFSNAMPELASQVQQFSDLWNQYRLRALLFAMRTREVLTAASTPWLVKFFQSIQPGLLASVGDSRPGLANGIRVEVPFQRPGRSGVTILSPLACGGVSMEINTSKKAQAPNPFEKARIKQIQKKVLENRNQPGSLWWPMGRDESAF